MKLIPLVLAAAGMVATAQAADTTEAGLMRCRSLSDAMARLACYDALPPVAGPSAAAAPTAAAARVVTPAAATAPPATAAAAPTPAAASVESSFGRPSPAAELQDIQSTLPGVFEGWERNTQFRLANGQLWKVIDGSSVSTYLRDPKVTVRRAAMGSFRMEIEGLKTAVRVQRVD